VAGKCVKGSSGQQQRKQQLVLLLVLTMAVVGAELVGVVTSCRQGLLLTSSAGRRSSE
jgi:hypothetical protein